MNTVKIKNTILGEGIPKICVPLTDRSLGGLKSSLNNMRDKHFDLIEWRVDKFEAFRQHITENADEDNSSRESTAADAADADATAAADACASNNYKKAVLSSCDELKRDGDNAVIPAAKSMNDIGIALKEAAALIRGAFPDKPIIFTIRTNRDMEDFEISDEAYAAAVSYAVGQGLGDIIDIEQSRGAALVIRLVNLAREYGIKTIVSKHLAKRTPAEADIINTLQDMQYAGADIVKLAVMPQNKAAVMSLLNATYRYAALPESVPVITMSMGRLGVLSRICGSLTGSCLTFGTVGAASAPGQIDCEELSHILDILS